MRESFPLLNSQSRHLIKELKALVAGDTSVGMQVRNRFAYSDTDGVSGAHRHLKRILHFLLMYNSNTGVYKIKYLIDYQLAFSKVSYNFNIGKNTIF